MLETSCEIQGINWAKPTTASLSLGKVRALLLMEIVVIDCDRPFDETIWFYDRLLDHGPGYGLFALLFRLMRP